MSIIISHLTKEIDGVSILKDINLEVRSGEVVGLLGPNGAGKTTLMKIIANALDYDSGLVQVCGVDTHKTPMLTMGKIGYLPEHNPLYEDMYVLEYLTFISDIYHVPASKKRVSELIQLVGLKREYKKRISELSKGYKQRVGLAQALLPDPEVLILDEPTTGLDPNQMVEIRGLIKEVGKDRTVLLSTHILQELKEMCSRAVILHEGCIVARIDDVNEIQYLNEKNVRLFLEFRNPISTADLMKVPGVEKVFEVDANHFHVESRIDNRENFFNLAVVYKNPLLTMRTISRTLEEVFRESTSTNVRKI